MPRMRLDEYGEWETPDGWAGDDEADELWPTTVSECYPYAPRKHPARLRIHLPMRAEGGTVSPRQVKQALAQRGIACEIRASRATGNWYIYVTGPSRPARRALHRAGVFWA